MAISFLELGVGQGFEREIQILCRGRRFGPPNTDQDFKGCHQIVVRDPGLFEVQQRPPRVIRRLVV